MTMLILLPNYHTHFNIMATLYYEEVVVTVNTVQVLLIGLRQKLHANKDLKNHLLNCIQDMDILA